MVVDKSTETQEKNCLTPTKIHDIMYFACARRAILMRKNAHAEVTLFISCAAYLFNPVCIGQKGNNSGGED